MHYKKLPGMAIITVVAATVSWGQFTQIVTDFSSGLTPFSEPAVLETGTYNSAPASMFLSDTNWTDEEGANVQTSFWEGTTFPDNPIHFQMYLKDTTSTPHEVSVHFNVGVLTNATLGWYHWLGMYFLAQEAWSGAEWAIGVDETLENIGSLKSIWEPAENTFANLYAAKRVELIELNGGVEEPFPLLLTLMIEVKNGTLFVDDISVTQSGSAVRQALNVIPPAPKSTGRLTVLPNGRIVNGAGIPTAAGYMIKLLNGQVSGTLVR